MKKLFSIALALILALSLVACRGTGKADPGDTSTDGVIGNGTDVNGNDNIIGENGTDDADGIDRNGDGIVDDLDRIGEDIRDDLDGTVDRDNVTGGDIMEPNEAANDQGNNGVTAPGNVG